MFRPRPAGPAHSSNGNSAITIWPHRRTRDSLPVTPGVRQYRFRKLCGSTSFVAVGFRAQVPCQQPRCPVAAGAECLASVVIGSGGTETALGRYRGSLNRRRSEMPGILVGIDGSAHSQAALEWAAKEAALRHTSLTVLTVHQAVSRLLGWHSALRGRRSAGREGASGGSGGNRQGAGQSRRRPPGIGHGQVDRGPGRTKRSSHAGADADMIVLGSRGGGGFSRLLLGSVSSNVAEHAKVPVMILPS